MVHMTCTRVGKFPRWLQVIAAVLAVAEASAAAPGPKFAGVSVLDRDHLVVSLIEGEVRFRDDGQGEHAKGGAESKQENWVEAYGILDTAAASDPRNWTITSDVDRAYGKKGKAPLKVHRKTKITGMAQLDWIEANRDYHYETPVGHELYLALPAALKPGAKYRVTIGAKVVPGRKTVEVSFDPFAGVSEAIHVNLVGFADDGTRKFADLYHWMGDGGARNYSTFVGAKVYVVDVKTGARKEAGTVAHWKPRGPDIGEYDLTASDVWTADFGPVPAQGRYRIAIEGVGCSREFAIGSAVYADVFKISVRGFYYMRIGEEEKPGRVPAPRQPPYIPGKAPVECKVVLTTMHPWHPEWKSFAGGDKWDAKEAWDRFAKPGRPLNPNARGGHSDALDWDRHLGHVSIIYDMLLPYLLTGGALSDDDCGIAESGNGIPDLLDEARNEVDFWLSLKVADGYGHGLNNATREHVFYQAGSTAVAAWANAANAAMLADCFRIAGRADLANAYREHAVTAWRHAEGLADKQLDAVQDVGGVGMRGADFRMTAAAYLFNLTGESGYEDAIALHSVVKTGDEDVVQKGIGQLWATAGYLMSPRNVRHPELRERMKRSVLRFAVEKETGLAAGRPSRRSSNQEEAYFHTAQNVQRAIVAHRISDDPLVRASLRAALTLEADWGLGRNPLNMIQMTTATTPLAGIRSVENAYTSGRNDGTPGLHPGHTPYFNMDDWGGEKGMIMARPRWMTQRNYPAFEHWPRGECAFNTRWVWAHSEFTPQQTMRGKTALYGYLYALGKGK